MRIRTPRELGTFIRNARTRRGLTQARLAACAGVSRTWVIDLEAGKRSLEIGRVMSVLDILGFGIELAEARAAGEPASAYGGLEIAPAEAVLARLDPKAGSRS